MSLVIFNEPEAELGTCKRGRKPTSYFKYISDTLFLKRAGVTKASKHSNDEEEMSKQRRKPNQTN